MVKANHALTNSAQNESDQQSEQYVVNQWKLKSNQPIRIESSKPIRVRNIQTSKRSANQSTKNLVNWHSKDPRAKFMAINQFRKNTELQTPDQNS